MNPTLGGRDRWFLDLDGTLADSSPAHAAAFRAALATWSPAVAAEFDYERHRGRTTDEVLTAVGVVDAGRRADLVRHKQAGYRAAVRTGAVRAHGGARALLERIAAAGGRAYLVSGASRASAEPVLAALGLADLLSGLVTAEDTVRGKPDPAPYRQARRRFCDDPARIVVVEDAPDGVAAARGAGLLVVQVHSATPEPGVPSYPDLGALLADLG